MAVPHRAADTLLVTSLPNELALEIFHQVTCTLTLRRAASACKQWLAQTSEAASIFQHAWLTVGATTIVDVLRCAPEGERILIREGTTLNSMQLICMRALDIRAEPNVRLNDGKLILQDTGNRVGVIEGLTILHWMEAAVLVSGSGGHARAPRWELRECSIMSSRRNARSATAINVHSSRHPGQDAGGSLRLVDCTIDSAIHAVYLERAPCSLSCIDCAQKPPGCLPSEEQGPDHDTAYH